MSDHLPDAGCDIGKLIYVFADGQVAVCPYIVFAARTPHSRYSDLEFLVGNILEQDVGPALDSYDFHGRYRMGDNATCGGCGVSSQCGKGCPAAVVARGGTIGELDTEQCSEPLLQIGRRMV
jgi:radical SAM protein with 4Fe4S-binding SPASM domain